MFSIAARVEANIRKRIKQLPLYNPYTYETQAFLKGCKLLVSINLIHVIIKDGDIYLDCTYRHRRDEIYNIHLAKEIIRGLTRTADDLDTN